MDVVSDRFSECTIRVGVLRGRHSSEKDKTQAHAWNIIQLSCDAPIFIADAMYAPHKLISVNSKEALLYKSGAGHTGVKSSNAHNGPTGQHVIVRAIRSSQLITQAKPIGSGTSGIIRTSISISISSLIYYC
jgi:hypothetical protein